MKTVVIVLVALVVLIVVHQVFFDTPPVTNPDPSGERIICFGDSLTFGTGAGSNESYPSRLGSLIGREVINAGVAGDTTAEALKRLDRDVLSHDPRIVLITLGGNDLMGDVPCDEAFANLNAIVRRIHQRGALVVVGGINVPLFDRGFDDAYKDLQRSTGCLLIPNILKGLIGKNNLMSDRIHPNGDGYAIMARRFQKEIEPYL
ncbi:MAG: arylesterase [Thermoanaerobaculales bacterium]|nr:arylesterase [Thermoanaerobaculales bacterium]